MPHKPTDAELLERYVKRQDSSALEILVEKHARLLMSVCLQVTHQQSDAEDAFQNTVVKLVSHAGQIKQPQYVSTWLYRVAQREALNLKSKQRRESLSSEPEQTAMTETSTDDQQQQEELLLLHEELEQLPLKWQGPLVLCYLEGKSREEAARELNVSLGSIKSSLESGRKQLKQRLLKRGIALASVLALWETSQASAGAIATSTLIHSAMSQSLANTTATGTASLSTSITGSKGFLTKGTMWMAASTGKKIGAGVLGALLLLGGSMAVVITTVDFGNQNEQTPPTPPALGQEMKELIAKIQGFEKQYENIEVNETTELEYFGEGREPLNGGPIVLNQPVEIAPLEQNPEATRSQSSQLKTRVLQKQYCFQEGLYRIEQFQDSINSHIEMESEGEERYWTQRYESKKWVQKESFDGNKEYRISNNSLKTKKVSESQQFDMNPYHLFLDNRRQGMLSLSELLTGRKTVSMNQGKEDEYLYHFNSRIAQKTELNGEPVLVVLIELTRHYLQDNEEPENNDEKVEPVHQTIWFKVFLSPDKNYLPVRYEQLRTTLNDNPDITYDVLSWNELDSNLWYPKSTVMSRFSTTKGELIYERKSNYQVLSLAPQYPGKHFQLEETDKPEEVLP